MKKKLSIVSVVLLVLLAGLQSSVSAIVFPDVPAYHNNYKAIMYLTDIGVVAGYETGEFCPEREITRTEFCALMARTMGFDKDTYVVKDLPFSDVPSGYWGISFISYCYEKGLIAGMGDGKFAPAEKVTVAQAAKMAVCAAGLEKKAKKIKGDKWYVGYMKVADNYSLLDKVTQNPDENAMRANTAQIVYNMRISGLVEIEEPVYVPEDSDNDDEESESFDETENPSTEKDEVVEQPILSEIDKAFLEKDYSEVKVIVVDAGHNYSGLDKGAYNAELDLHEEVITWQVADRLREKLEDAGYEVWMTREDVTDSIANASLNSSLKARVELAHEALADLFISIHCNMGGGMGSETYCFSFDGYAHRLASLVQENLSETTELYNRGVKTANFFVIKYTAMPAILVETGFLDNESDAEFLVSEEGQELIAQAIADAVVEYDEMPPIEKKELPEPVQEEETEETDEDFREEYEDD